MQVDTAALREAAARLRAEVGDPVEKAGSRMIEATMPLDLGLVFDSYTTAAPYRDATGAWGVEITTLTMAVADLATALEAAADDYDAADAAAADRVAKAPRIEGPR
jgi:hypothetical protein